MDKKPNVLILLADQQRWDTINYLGNSHMITPNLDRLAKEGCSYVNAHTPNPLCMPARHCLLTGLQEIFHGYYVNRNKPIKDYNIPTIPRIFSENGYRTAAIGKMHFYPVRSHHGFNELQLMEEVPRHCQDDAYMSYLKNTGYGNIQNLHGVRPHVYHVPQMSQVPARHHGTFWLSRQVINWLKNNEDNPFFLMASWIQPHPPWNIPEEYLDLYKQRSLPEPEGISRLPFNKESEYDWYGDREPEALKKSVRQSYYTSITMVDKAIGNILDYLERTKQIDNTLVIFTSDHGEMLQDKGYYCKKLPYDGSVRIPMIVRYPEIFTQDIVNESFTDLYDIMPTCLDICNIAYPESEVYKPSGCSLRNEGVLKNRKYQISSCGNENIYNSRWVMCRDRKYKYIYHYNQAYEELYDLEKDPGETVNFLSKGPPHPAKWEELRKQVRQFESKNAPFEPGPDNNLKKFDHGLFSPDIHGKYHYWMNLQMHRSDKREKKQRAEQFIREIKQALSNKKHSIVSLSEVFNDPEWIDNLLKNWQQYGEGNELQDLLL